MSLSVTGVWEAGVWATTVWEDGVWREGAYAGGSLGRLPTIFTSSPVPSTAVYAGGQAFAPTGELYVCSLPANPVFLDGIAHRQDGAMCVTTSGTAVVSIAGWDVTDSGEVVVTNSTPDTYLAHEIHGVIGLLETGEVCMTDVS